MARRKDSDADTAEGVTTAPVGLWEDFVDIFYAPAEVFARRRSGKFAYALLFLTLAGVVLHFLLKNGMQPVMDAEFEFRRAEVLRSNPQMTSEQMNAGRGFFEAFAPVIFAVTFPITIILTGGILWAAGKLFDAKESVVAAIMISTYSQVPRLVQFLITAAQGLFMDSNSITSAHSVSIGLARFLDPVTTQPVLLALASRVDLFTIWVTILLAIGLHIVGRIPKQSAAIAAAITWLVGGFPVLFGALRAS
jgi:hypothetical protein